ncbi:MAG: hypothetical protein QNL01_05785 [Akkermansiaceae bacterium]|jgi:hypothetical protein|tara:strand:- start:8994 stop:9200 length:207 start_codon:yes stop_codon:yes gene_type:complete
MKHTLTTITTIIALGSMSSLSLAAPKGLGEKKARILVNPTPVNPQNALPTRKKLFSIAKITTLGKKTR